LFSVKTYFLGWREADYYSDEYLKATYIIAPDLKQYCICMEFLEKYGEIIDLTQDELVNHILPKSVRLDETISEKECTHRLTMADEDGMAKWVRCEKWVLDKYGQYTLRASLNKNQRFDYLHYSNLDPKSWVTELEKIRDISL